MHSRGDLAGELKRLVEALHPDLRPFFRPSLLGKVVAVDDDNYRVDVVVGGDEESGEAGLALPEVPDPPEATEAADARRQSIEETRRRSAELFADFLDEDASAASREAARDALVRLHLPLV